MERKSVTVTVLVCLVILLTTINLGLYSVNRILVKNQQTKLTQVQTAINNRDKQVQQFIGQLKATKTIGEVQELLSNIK